MINNNVVTRAGNIVNNQNSHEIERSGVEVASCGTILKGVLIKPKGTTKPLPCVIMAPGMAGVKEGSILKYAEYFAPGGFAVVAYDNINFGESGGEPRQEADPQLQRRGYRDAITFATLRPEVDRSRIGVFGTSYSGGNALEVAAHDRRVKCVVSQALARLHQMQSDLAHINRVSMMGELAASLSHEITQPIASARNNARAAQNFLEKQPADLGEVREALAGVVGDVDRARDIIDGIREHMKKAPPRKERFDLSAAINEMLVLARSTIIRNGVSVQTRLADGLFAIQGDRVQLQQVVLNLVLNAVEAMGSVEAGPRELLISTEQDHTGVIVAVRDSGPGIDPMHLERVFEAFYTTKSSGLGMGLAICRSIIDAHGGRLWAAANEPRGAVFQFTLPKGE